MLGISKIQAAAVAGLLLFVAGCNGAWWAAYEVRGILSDREEAGARARDAVWTAKISEANAKAAEDQRNAAAAAEAAAQVVRQEAAALRAKISELEAQNAALPAAAAGGVDLARVRLLNRARRPNR